MRDMPLPQAVMLRERAAHCREIARNALSEEIAREMLIIAEQYEREADDVPHAADGQLMELGDA